MKKVRLNLGVYLALSGVRLLMRESNLRDILNMEEWRNQVDIPIDESSLEKLLEAGRRIRPGFTCLQAALVFRALKPVRICLGVKVNDYSQGHAWVKDNNGNHWLYGSRDWAIVWTEE